MVLTLNNVILRSTLRIGLILIRVVLNEEKIDNYLENQRKSERYSIINPRENFKSETTRKNGTNIQQCYPKFNLVDQVNFNYSGTECGKN
jgi:hypothetical protein